MKKWEYKTVSEKDVQTDKQLNNLGKKGWELVLIHPHMDGSGWFTYLFKRNIKKLT